MGRLTLRLPDTLHRELESQAQREKVSLNQYLVYALTRQVAMAYTVTPVPEGAIWQQREAFAALLLNLGQASPSEIQKALAEREHVELEPELPPDVAARLRQRIAATSTMA
ncbi:MAG: hypothetical protein AUK03_14410 [Anaerolineae bacterium CG2_30_64_16]|nr:MAG: hypothetical protein AUK03_14410 [Anaerolineae bacterium CG2_30_64_16]